MPTSRWNEKWCLSLADRLVIISSPGAPYSRRLHGGTWDFRHAPANDLARRKLSIQNNVQLGFYPRLNTLILLIYAPVLATIGPGNDFA
jgi:hypothetical protein